MPETFVGQGGLIGLGLKSRITPFQGMKNVGDIRSAKHETQMLQKHELQAHVDAAHGDIDLFADGNLIAFRGGFSIRP